MSFFVFHQPDLCERKLLIISRDGYNQLRRDRHCGLDLLEPIIEIHVGNRILRGMVVWVAFSFFVILDLQAGC
jgi:hypothetical protein